MWYWFAILTMSLYHSSFFYGPCWKHSWKWTPEANNQYNMQQHNSVSCVSQRKHFPFRPLAIEHVEQTMNWFLAYQANCLFKDMYSCCLWWVSTGLYSLLYCSPFLCSNILWCDVLWMLFVMVLHLSVMTHLEYWKISFCARWWVPALSVT